MLWVAMSFLGIYGRFCWRQLILSFLECILHTTDNFDEVNFSEIYIKSSDKMNFDKWLDSAFIKAL